jgi:formylglycine-generating enzyme required for sulfatase activity
VAWFTECINDKGASAVATRKANELGIFDMSGNVYEWCADWYGDYEKDGKIVPIDPKGVVKGSRRVLRGGCWVAGARGCRTATRSGRPSGHRNHALGFRLALSLQ